MSDRAELARNLRQLIELDRGFGVEFVLRSPAAAPEKAVPPPQPAPRRESPKTEAPPSGPPEQALAAVAEKIAACTACRLRAGCSRTVPGEGNPQPQLLFIGEGPGADEDRLGRPFVGAAGQLLDKMIAAMGFKREDVFIANIIKCRPPGNRTPEPDEVAQCLPFLRQQIAILKPKVICTLGNTPLRALFGDNLGITSMRGKKLDYAGITVIPTFHPSYLLRNPAMKKPCWADLQVVLAELKRE